jgi:ATP adenylyltransferase
MDIQQMVRMSVNVLKGVYNPDGFNLGVNLGRVAGAGVEGHIHWHVVPRWSGDTNFMPVISDIRVIPDSLEATYKRLKEQYEVICGR